MNLTHDLIAVFGGIFGLLAVFSAIGAVLKYRVSPGAPHGVIGNALLDPFQQVESAMDVADRIDDRIGGCLRHHAAGGERCGGAGMPSAGDVAHFRVHRLLHLQHGFALLLKALGLLDEKLMSAGVESVIHRLAPSSP